MKLFKVIVFVVVAAMSLGCEDRFDFLADGNRVPTAQFVTDEGLKTNLSDSLKTSLKNGQEFYDVSLYVFDAEGLPAGLTAVIQTGSGTFYQGGVQVTSFTYDLDGYADLQYKPSASGIHIVRFLITDNLGNVGAAELTLNVFANLAPVATFKLVKIGINNTREYDFDATGAKDLDVNKGGGIEVYEYSVNGVLLTSPNPITRFVFPASGNYEIRLTVIDNDGARSAEYTTLPQSIN